jgi:hypothetical protein
LDIVIALADSVGNVLGSYVLAKANKLVLAWPGWARHRTGGDLGAVVGYQRVKLYTGFLVVVVGA